MISLFTRTMISSTTRPLLCVPLHRGHQEFLAQRFQHGVVEQVVHRWGRRPEAVCELATHLLASVLGGNLGDALVGAQAQIFTRNVLWWDANIEPQVERGAQFRSARLALQTRSEEHTSELQSLAYLVCRLLLEKKKNHDH